jgi:hypothetical protein
MKCQSNFITITIKWKQTRALHVRPLDSLIWEPPCIFNHPNLGTLACCFPTRPIWNLGFIQPSILKKLQFGILRYLEADLTIS